MKQTEIVRLLVELRVSGEALGVKCAKIGQVKVGKCAAGTFNFKDTYV